MNISESDKARVSESMKEIYESNADKVKNLELISQSLEQKMSLFQPKLINFLKLKCQQEYEWISKYTKVNESNGEMSIDVPKDQVAEAEEKFKSWENCAQQNDNGTKDFFMSVEQSNAELGKTNEECIMKCLNEVQSKSNIELKSCLSTCFSSYFDNTEKTLKNVISKIDLLEKNSFE